MAMIAALEDKVIQPHELVNTRNGILTFFDRYKVRDSRKGGYGLIPFSKAFEVSSNTAMVKMIYDHYKRQPRKFVDRLYNMGLNEKLGVSILGEGNPSYPIQVIKIEWNFSPLMAYGYGVELTRSNSCHL